MKIYVGLPRTKTTTTPTNLFDKNNPNQAINFTRSELGWGRKRLKILVGPTRAQPRSDQQLLHVVPFDSMLKLVGLDWLGLYRRPLPSP